MDRAQNVGVTKPGNYLPPLPVRAPVELRPLSSIRPAQLNPRTHNVPLLERAIRRFGFCSVLVLDANSGTLVAGHGRRLALLALQARAEPPPRGITERAGEWYVPTTLLHAQDAQEARAYQLADNRVGEHTSWEREGLASLLGALAQEQRADGLGWDPRDLAACVAYGAATASDRPPHTEPEVEAEPRTRQLTIVLERATHDATLPRLAAAQRRHGTSTYAQLLDALLTLSETHSAT